MIKATSDEWKAIGDQANKCRDELHILLLACNGKMPKSTTEGIRKSLKYLNRFRSEAENRMMKTSDNKNLNVFYGE